MEHSDYGKTDRYIDKKFLAAAIFWMGAMFYMSARSADLSSADSGFVHKLLDYMMEHCLPCWTAADSARHYDLIEFLVRKTAHFTEYAVLSILVNLAFRIRRRWLLIIIPICFAVSDEFHQLFVSGRAASVRDVLIDSAGALFGLLLLLCISYSRSLNDGSRSGRIIKH